MKKLESDNKFTSILLRKKYILCVLCVQVFSNLFKWIYRQIYGCSARRKTGRPCDHSGSYTVHIRRLNLCLTLLYYS